MASWLRLCHIWFSGSKLRNHAVDTNYPDKLDEYLRSELMGHSTAGPFAASPFPRDMAISPLISVAKKDSDERRIILDLSWPLNTSVNAGIDNDFHEGLHFELVYPTVDDIACLIAQIGHFWARVNLQV